MLLWNMKCCTRLLELYLFPLFICGYVHSETNRNSDSWYFEPYEQWLSLTWIEEQQNIAVFRSKFELFEAANKILFSTFSIHFILISIWCCLNQVFFSSTKTSLFFFYRPLSGLHLETDFLVNGVASVINNEFFEIL